MANQASTSFPRSIAVPLISGPGLTGLIFVAGNQMLHLLLESTSGLGCKRVNTQAERGGTSKEAKARAMDRERSWITIGGLRNSHLARTGSSDGRPSGPLLRRVLSPLSYRGLSLSRETLSLCYLIARSYVARRACRSQPVARSLPSSHHHLAVLLISHNHLFWFTRALSSISFLTAQKMPTAAWFRPIERFARMASTRVRAVLTA